MAMRIAQIGLEKFDAAVEIRRAVGGGFGVFGWIVEGQCHPEFSWDDDGIERVERVPIDWLPSQKRAEQLADAIKVRSFVPAGVANIA